ncbi:MAG: hypothetical protein ACM3WP_11790 [Acidobacteriota bacterium]
MTKVLAKGERKDCAAAYIVRLGTGDYSDRHASLCSAGSATAPVPTQEMISDQAD